MKKHTKFLLAAFLLAAAAVAGKHLFPEWCADFQQKTAEVLSLDDNYLAVFAELGKRLDFRADGAQQDGSREESPSERQTGSKAEESANGESDASEPASPSPEAGIDSRRAEEGMNQGEYGGRFLPTDALRRETVEQAEALPSPDVSSAEISVSDNPQEGDAAEGADVSEEALPAAVSAFLEEQKPFLDEHPLPENVDYSYQPLPFDFAVPVTARKSSGFGFRVHPILEDVRFHYGTDIAAMSGEDIFCFADGTVRLSGTDEEGYGNYLIVDHGDGWSTLYGHCSRLFAETGQSVKKGEKIALVGSTGRVTGPHLHFELRKDGVFHNPEYYING